MTSETIRIQVHDSTQDAVAALQQDSSMVGDVFEARSECAVGIAVTPKTIFALTIDKGAFTRVDNAEQVEMLRSFRAYGVARALIAYEPELYTWEGA